MGTIKEEIELVGIRGRKRICALFDSGASRNYVKRILSEGQDVDQVGFHIFEGMHRTTLANGQTVMGERVRFKEMRVMGRRLSEPVFVILDDLVEDAIIGVGTMQDLEVALDFSDDRIVFKLP